MIFALNLSWKSYIIVVMCIIIMYCIVFFLVYLGVCVCAY